MSVWLGVDPLEFLHGKDVDALGMLHHTQHFQVDEGFAHGKYLQTRFDAYFNNSVLKMRVEFP